MIESVPSLAVTLAQIRALAEERQLTAAEILDVEDLAARTGVPPEVVAGLLRGEDPAEAAPGETARRRAAFLCARSRDAAGHPYRAADIAEAIGAAPASSPTSSPAGRGTSHRKRNSCASPRSSAATPASSPTPRRRR